MIDAQKNVVYTIITEGPFKPYKADMASVTGSVNVANTVQVPHVAKSLYMGTEPVSLLIGIVSTSESKIHRIIDQKERSNWLAFSWLYRCWEACLSQLVPYVDYLIILPAQGDCDASEAPPHHLPAHLLLPHLPRLFPNSPDLFLGVCAFLQQISGHPLCVGFRTGALGPEQGPQAEVIVSQQDCKSSGTAI